jgi:hypothetical protein
MITNHTPSLEAVIRDYLEQKDKSIVYGKKRLESEKEYNRLLTKYEGEAKHYSLEHADKIYKAYHEMLANGEQAKNAQELFMAAEEKLKEAGRILFEATINAEIAMTPPINGEATGKKSVRIAYNNGQVIVS